MCVPLRGENDRVTTNLFEGRKTVALEKPVSERYPTWVTVLFLTVVFGVSYGQFRLYYFTQNQYFFHGLARAGFGLLRNDWLAGTADTWPVFSRMVELTYRYLDERLFYVYYAILLGVYAYSMLGIASSLFRIDRSASRYLACLAMLTVVHSPAFNYLAENVTPYSLGRVLITGVASQRILWDMLHPGAFGVFGLLSIHLFLQRKLYPSIIALVVAVVFHPVYVLSAGVLTLAYLVIMARRGENLKNILAVGACAFVLVAPVLAYVYLVFRPSSPEIGQQAQAILVHFRLAVHAVPGKWVDLLDNAIYLKVVVVLLGMYVIRRTELFWVMFVATLVAMGLTAVQLVTGSDTLALLFPWRLSVFLVPIATTIVITAVVSAVLDRIERRFAGWQRAIAVISMIVLIMLTIAGGVATKRRWAGWFGEENLPVLNHVRATKAAGQTYLIPVRWRYFRLSTGAPVFVDFWFIPYSDIAVLEWHKRLGLAEAFYAAKDDTRCQMMKAMAESYGVTHVVVRESETPACPAWRLTFQNRDYALYSVGP
jgi:hypothetical protein